MLIGISGFEGSGKNTVADILMRNYQFSQDSFASKLKDVLAVVFGWDRTMLEGTTEHDRAARFEVDTWWANRLNIENFTPKSAMKTIGTDLFRTHFHTDIWVASLERKLANLSGNVVISDVRFPNEAAAIKNLGGKLIRVKRGPEPEWYKYALIANTQPDNAEYCRNKLAEFNVHSSETAWIGIDFDEIIENIDTVSYLEKQVDLLIKKFL